MTFFLSICSPVMELPLTSYLLTMRRYGRLIPHESVWELSISSLHVPYPGNCFVFRIAMCGVYLITINKDRPGKQPLRFLTNPPDCNRGELSTGCPCCLEALTGGTCTQQPNYRNTLTSQESIESPVKLFTLRSVFMHLFSKCFRVPNSVWRCCTRCLHKEFLHFFIRSNGSEKCGK